MSPHDAASEEAGNRRCYDRAPNPEFETCLGHGPKTTTGFPLFDGKKQQKTLFQALCRPNATLQVIDYIGIQGEFRYAAEQRNFGGLTEEINGRTAEVQWNLSVRLLSGR
jgi:hypothetical protein